MADFFILLPRDRGYFRFQLFVNIVYKAEKSQVNEAFSRIRGVHVPLQKSGAWVMKTAILLGIVFIFFSSRVAGGEENCNALVTAAANCDEKAVKILLDSGVSPNCRADADHNLPGSTAPWSFLSSRCQGSAEMLDLFIFKGYAVNLQNMPSGKTPSSTALHAASIVGNVEAVRTLLDHGADPRVRDQDNMTALEYAVRFEHHAVVALLVSHLGRLR